MPGTGVANAFGPEAVRDLGTTLLNSLDDAIIATDTEGTIVFWNRAAERLYGWTADEVLGLKIVDVTPSPTSRQQAFQILELLNRGETWSGEFETHNKDGRTLSVHVIDYPVRNTQGKLTGIVGVSRLLADRTSETATLDERADRKTETTLSAIKRAWPTSSQQSTVQGIAIAVGLYFAAIALRLALDPIFIDRLPFITFFPAIVIAAIFAGLWPTVALLTAFVVTGAWRLPPEGVDAAFRIWALIGFFIVSSLIIVVVTYTRRIQHKLVLHEAQLALINRELKHRLQNVFAITNSICLQSLKTDLPPEEMGRAISGRIMAVAAAQNLLSVSSDEGATLQALVDAVIVPLAPDNARLEVSGDDAKLPADVATPMALVLHELGTNAVKYGAWSAPNGHVRIEWSTTEKMQLNFRWGELGVAVAAKPRRVGFGTTLIQRALNGASVKHEIGPHGVECSLSFSLR